ncbi:hypothetical protein D3C85_1608950 [compost metagenome]
MARTDHSHAASRIKAGLGRMAAATLGGYGGARLARHIPAPWLRAGIVVTGLVMSALFFWQQ